MELKDKKELHNSTSERRSEGASMWGNNNEPSYYDSLPQSLISQIASIAAMKIYPLHFSGINLQIEPHKLESDQLPPIKLSMMPQARKTIISKYYKPLNITVLVSLDMYFYKNNHLLSIFYSLYKNLPEGSNVRFFVGDDMQCWNKAYTRIIENEDFFDSLDETLSSSEENGLDSSEEKALLEKINVVAKSERDAAIKMGENWASQPLVVFGLHLLKTKGITSYIDYFSKWAANSENGTNHAKHEELISDFLKRDTKFKSSFGTAVLNYCNTLKEKDPNHFNFDIAEATSKKYVFDEYVVLSKYCAAINKHAQDWANFFDTDNKIAIHDTDPKNDLRTKAILYAFKKASNPLAYLFCRILQHHKLNDIQFTGIQVNKTLECSLTSPIFKAKKERKNNSKANNRPQSYTHAPKSLGIFASNNNPVDPPFEKSFIDNLTPNTVMSLNNNKITSQYISYLEELSKAQETKSNLEKLKLMQAMLKTTKSETGDNDKGGYSPPFSLQE